MEFKTKDTGAYPVKDVRISACTEYVALKQEDGADEGIHVVVIPLHRVPAFIKALLKVYLKSLKGTK